MVADESSAVQAPTRERLLAAGTALFGEQGYRATTVGQIEAAAGLQPRRGALYRHFPSKQALLEAAVQQHLDAVAAIAEVVAGADEGAGSVRATAAAVGHWLLGELDRQWYLTRILEQDGDLVPELRDRFRAGVSDAGYRAMAVLLRRWAGPGADGLDLDAWGVTLASPLINHRRSTWTFRRPPLAVDDERAVAAWAEVCARVVASLTDEAAPASST